MNVPEMTLPHITIAHKTIGMEKELASARLRGASTATSITADTGRRYTSEYKIRALEYDRIPAILMVLAHR